MKKKRGNESDEIIHDGKKIKQKTMKELNVEELKSINGGNVPMAYYMDNDVIKANKNVLDFFVGIFVGFWS
jgi:bacteriocin-like protein